VKKKTTTISLDAVPARILVSIVIAACAAGVACSSDRPASAPADSAQAQTALAADAAWIAALTSTAPAAAGSALDAEFEWTNSHGRTHTRAEALQNLQGLAADLRGETDIQRYDYGHVHVVTSARDGARMMRVWALWPEGWRALGVITTTLVTGTTPFAASGAATGDCDNPCRTMPYTPTSENARQIAAIFQRLKMDEWHPDPADWAPYVLDDVYYVTETAQLSKADRVERLAALKKSGAPSTPGDPVVSMKIHDFGDSAVMIARHTPYRGGDPYYSLRVWAFRDGRWQLANTQQTVIRSTQAASTS
jgi:hypothetical protein